MIGEALFEWIQRRFLSPKTLYRAGAMVLLLATLLKRQDLITRD